MRLGELGLANEISNPSEAAKMEASRESTCLDMENRPRSFSRMVDFRQQEASPHLNQDIMREGFVNQNIGNRDKCKSLKIKLNSVMYTRSGNLIVNNLSMRLQILSL